MAHSVECLDDLAVSGQFEPGKADSRTERLRELSQPCLSRWLTAVALDWLIIAVAMACAYFALQSDHWLKWPVVAGVVVVIGARQHGLGLMGHDAAHRLACRNKRLNDILASLLCFWPMGSSLLGYRAFHFKHHRTVGTADDPERIHTRHRWLGQWRLLLRPWRVLGLVASDTSAAACPTWGWPRT